MVEIPTVYDIPYDKGKEKERPKAPLAFNPEGSLRTADTAGRGAVTLPLAQLALDLLDVLEQLLDQLVDGGVHVGTNFHQRPVPLLAVQSDRHNLPCTRRTRSTLHLEMEVDRVKQTREVPLDFGEFCGHVLAETLARLETLCSNHNARHSAFPHPCLPQTICSLEQVKRYYHRRHFLSTDPSG